MLSHHHLIQAQKYVGKGREKWEGEKGVKGEIDGREGQEER